MQEPRQALTSAPPGAENQYIQQNRQFPQIATAKNWANTRTFHSQTSHQFAKITLHFSLFPESHQFFIGFSPHRQRGSSFRLPTTLNANPTTTRSTPRTSLMPRLHGRALSLVTLALLLLNNLNSHADETAPTSRGRIFGRVWHTTLRPEDGFSYLNTVREQLGVPQSPVMLMGGAAGRVSVGMGPRRIRKPDEAAPDMAGTLFFLQTLPEVSLNNPITFETCESRDQFEELVRQQAGMMGPAVEILGEDDRFEVKLDFEKLRNAAPRIAPAGPGKGEVRQSISIAIVATADVGDAAGKPPEPPKSMSTWYRYQDGVMYSCRSDALHTLDLPTREELKLDEEHSGQDLYADFDFTQVPSDFRQAFWAALESQASVFLQRFDNEAEGTYSLRRVLAEGRLELLRRVMFDIDRARFTLKLSAAAGEPVVSQLRIRARENSTLASFLSVVSNQGTQLAALQDEASPLVISTTVAIPESIRPFLAVLAGSSGLRLKEAAGDTPAAAVLVDDLVASLQQTVEYGIFDASLCLRGTVENGLLPCGGLRLESAEKFLDALEFLLQATSASEAVTVSRSENDDYRMLSIRAEKTPVPFAGNPIPLQLNLAATGSWLWFTVGNEPAVQMLEEIVAGSEQALQKNSIGSPLLVRMQLSQWLGQTDDALSKVPGQWLETLERWLQKTTAPRMSFTINGQASNPEPAEQPKFNSYASKALTKEDSDVELKIRSAEQELLVDASVGTGIARFAVAQFLDAQSRMFSNMRFSFGATGQGGAIKLQVGGPGGAGKAPETPPKQ